MTLARPVAITGAVTPAERLALQAHGATIPRRLSMDPRTAYYDAKWSPRVRTIRWQPERGGPSHRLLHVVEFDTGDGDSGGWAMQQIQDRWTGRPILVAGLEQYRTRHGRIAVEFVVPLSEAA